MLGLVLAFAMLPRAIPAAADAPDDRATPLPGTKPLTMKGNIASELVAGVDRFLLKGIEKSVARRAAHWKRDFSSAEAYTRSIEPNRKRLAHILGVRDRRVPFDAPELVGTTEQPALVGRGTGYEVFAVRWPAVGGVHGEGLLLLPTGKKKLADVVAIPDADQTPEQLVGLVPGVPAKSQFARRLAESGCRVIVPTLISRKMEKRDGRANLTNREFLYRSAFELGRHLIGYELEKVLAAVDWFAKEGGKDAKVGVMGYGEGGMLALYAGALDTRIRTVCVSGYFGNRHDIWQQPIDRNVFGLLDEFGDAELALMTLPRYLIVEHAPAPEVTLPSEGGAPAKLVGPTRQEFEKERRRARGLLPRKYEGDISSNVAFTDFGESATLFSFLQQLASAKLHEDDKAPENLRKKFDPEQRQKRLIQEIDRHSQKLLAESPSVRREFLKKLADLSNLAGNKPVPLEQYQTIVEDYRRFFRDEVIGHFDYKLLPFNARSRKAYDKPKWTGYEVVLDVFPDVIAYGVLLLPKDLKDGEKRPVVVCQHGLEGRPKDVITGNHPAYHDFAARLAERGFITFAPQNLYIFHDRFRTLQRKANPIKKTLFSVIVPQHQQIVNWLKTLPNVDPKRIGFYGLSYGGKSAMRIPPLVPDYCLSICSADFNDWVWKNASSRDPYSYVWTGEYEIFEFDLGSTFNYAEMAALIAPRPFMVERGHFDTVGPDERVAYEFAKVRFLYEARLGLKDRCEIEWFVGPHTINGKGTFDFLHKHLNWPKR
jgi:dienelactone hydrolase